MWVLISNERHLLLSKAFVKRKKNYLKLSMAGSDQLNLWVEGLKCLCIHIFHSMSDTFTNGNVSPWSEVNKKKYVYIIWHLRIITRHRTDYTMLNPGELGNGILQIESSTTTHIAHRIFFSVESTFDPNHNDT